MNDTVPDYSEYKDGPGDNLLARLSGLAQEQRDAEIAVEQAEEALQKAKDNLRTIRERKLPELMDEAEMTEFTTKDGLKIKVSEQIRAGIPKAKAAQAIKWLEDNGHENLVKRQFVIEFGKDEEGWAKRFAADLKRRKRPLNTKTDRKVHPQTLAAFVREQLQEGVDIPQDLLGVHRQKVSKVEVKS